MADRPTREELLKRMGIEDANFRDYLKKSAHFVNSLDKNQKRFHLEHLPERTVEQVAESLGPDVTEEDVRLLFAEAPPIDGVMYVMCCKHLRHLPHLPHGPKHPDAR